MQCGVLGDWVLIVTPICMWLCQCCKNNKIKQGMSISISPRLVIDLKNEFQAYDGEMRREGGKYLQF